MNPKSRPRAYLIIFLVSVSSVAGITLVSVSSCCFLCLLRLSLSLSRLLYLSHIPSLPLSHLALSLFTMNPMITLS